MTDIDELINRAKTLVSLNKKAPKKGRTENDIFIHQNRPVHTTDWSTERDVIFISIYLPSRLPDVSLPHKSIVLHNHTVFDHCVRDRYCHLYGWNVPERDLRIFNSIWGYLYNPTANAAVQLGKVDLSL